MSLETPPSRSHPQSPNLNFSLALFILVPFGQSPSIHHYSIQLASRIASECGDPAGSSVLDARSLQLEPSCREYLRASSRERLVAIAYSLPLIVRACVLVRARIRLKQNSSEKAQHSAPGCLASDYFFLGVRIIDPTV